MDHIKEWLDENMELAVLGIGIAVIGLFLGGVIWLLVASAPAIAAQEHTYETAHHCQYENITTTGVTIGTDGKVGTGVYTTRVCTPK